MTSNANRNPQRRRSDTIRATGRRLLDWDGNRPFQILAIDGGGIKGLFPAAILTYLEEHCLDSQPIGDYFDLIAGASTGGIIALGLAAGLPAKSLTEPYLEQGWQVFPPNRYKWLTRFCIPLVRNRYNRDNLDQLLQETLGDITLKPVIQDGYILLDGGVRANNPTLMGLIEALTCFNIKRENISVLSISKVQTSGAGQWR